jgi:hypothetical protein
LIRKKKNSDLIIALPLLCMVLISPLPVLGRLKINAWIHDLFMPPTAWLRNSIFPKAPKFDGFYTDSMNYVLLLVFTVAIGMFIAILIQKSRLNSPSILFCTEKSIIYYLSWIFLIYGFSKILGVQFPENVDPSSIASINDNNLDLQFWSYMGAHQDLVIFLGVVEIVVASFLLFKKTRKLGLLMFTAAILVIVVINFKFEISVRIFSVLLLLAGFYSLINHLAFPIFTKNNENSFTQVHDTNFTQPMILKPLKLFVIALMFISAFFNSWQV